MSSKFEREFLPPVLAPHRQMAVPRDFESPRRRGQDSDWTKSPKLDDVTPGRMTVYLRLFEGKQRQLLYPVTELFIAFSQYESRLSPNHTLTLPLGLQSVTCKGFRVLVRTRALLRVPTLPSFFDLFASFERRVSFPVLRVKTNSWFYFCRSSFFTSDRFSKVLRQSANQLPTSSIVLVKR